MEFASAILTLLVFLISLYSYFFVIRRKSNNTATHGFRAFPLVGALPDFILNRHHFLDWSAGILAGCPANTTIFRRYGKVHGILTANPEVVEHILKLKFDNYPKGQMTRELMKDFLGTGIFNADDDLWKVQRKTASYEFNTKSLRNFVLQNATFELKQRLIPVLETAAKADKVLDFQDVLERFAFDNICKVAFNYDPACLGGESGDGTVGTEFMKAFENAASLSIGRLMTAFEFLIKIKKFLNVGSEKKLRQSIATVHDFADKIIETRMNGRSEKNDEDLLSRFIGNDGTNAEHLRDIVISFILAGRDTTSAALTWFFWLLSSNPDVEEKIQQELASIRHKNLKSIGDIYTFEELRGMHYLHAAISESMRLYPPVPLEKKFCMEDDILPDGTFVGKGWFVSYYAYAMGRMESIWGKDCFEYKPERWIEDGICKQVSPFKYPVFHAGPRICLGKDMAYIQMKSIAASVLDRFSLDVALEKGKSPEQLLSLTLRMKGGLPVRVKERELIEHVGDKV